MTWSQTPISQDPAASAAGVNLEGKYVSLVDQRFFPECRNGDT